MKVNILDTMDEKACMELFQSIRWESGVVCVSCGQKEVSKDGKSDNHEHCQRYECKSCGKKFDDFTNTPFSGTQLLVKQWIACMYLLGLNLSNNQIAAELDISLPTAQSLTETIREGIAKKNLIYNLMASLK